MWQASLVGANTLPGITGSILRSPLGKDKRYDSQNPTMGNLLSFNGHLQGSHKVAKTINNHSGFIKMAQRLLVMSKLWVLAWEREIWNQKLY